LEEEADGPLGAGVEAECVDALAPLRDVAGEDDDEQCRHDRSDELPERLCDRTALVAGSAPTTRVLAVNVAGSAAATGVVGCRRAPSTGSMTTTPSGSRCSATRQATWPPREWPASQTSSAGAVGGADQPIESITASVSSAASAA
jgi:hypothetical protein